MVSSVSSLRLLFYFTQRVLYSLYCIKSIKTVYQGLTVHWKELNHILFNEYSLLFMVTTFYIGIICHIALN